MAFSGLHAPLQGDLVHAAAQRSAQPCHLHLSHSHIGRRPALSRHHVQSSSGKHELAQADHRPRKHCLGQTSSQHKRRTLQTCAVADEVRQSAATESASTPASGSQVSGEQSLPSQQEISGQQQPPSQPSSTELPGPSSPAQSPSPPSSSIPDTAQAATPQPSATPGPSGLRHPVVPPPDGAAGSLDSAAGSSQARQYPGPNGPPNGPPSGPNGQRPPYRGMRNRGGRDGHVRTEFTSSRDNSRPAPIPIPQADAEWLMPGSVVVAEVVFSNANGCKVEMLKDRRVCGWCPAAEAPYMLRDDTDHLKLEDRSGLKDLMKPGMVREFKVIKVARELAYHGQGPMISARVHDLDILWRRTYQLFDCCAKDKEIITVDVLDVNQGGLISRCQSLQAFIPISHLARDKNNWLSQEELGNMQGKKVDVTIIEVDPNFRKIVLSIGRADQYKQLKAIHLGALMWGEVRRIEEFGCFVGLDGTRISGLLHISNISRARVESVADVFQLGERVRCLVMGMDDNFTRISLSTAELEANDGDIMYDKEKVYENADAQAKLFMEYVQSSKDEIDDFDFEGDRVYDGGSYDDQFAGNTKHNSV